MSSSESDYVPNEHEAVYQPAARLPAISAGRLANRRVKPASHHLVKLGERLQEELP